jgi:hypothetical protein
VVARRALNQPIADSSSVLVRKSPMDRLVANRNGPHSEHTTGRGFPLRCPFEIKFSELLQQRRFSVSSLHEGFDEDEGVDREKFVYHPVDHFCWRFSCHRSADIKLLDSKCCTVENRVQAEFNLLQKTL